MRTDTKALLVSLWVLLGGCRSPSREEAFQVPRTEFFASTKTIAVLPLRGMDGKPVQQGRGIEPDIEEALAQAGFGVVPASAFRAEWEEAESGDAGLFDPRTGQLDRIAFARREERCLDELARSHVFDAVLVPTLEVVSAPFWGGYARWDGLDERMWGSGELDARVEDYEGVLRALSLRIEIREREGTLLYRNRGGIQTLSRIEAGGFVGLEREEILVDRARNQRGVRLALDPVLAGRSGTR